MERPDWLGELTQHIAQNVEVVPLLGWGAYIDEDEIWVIEGFPAFVEVLGEVVVPELRAELSPLIEFFDNVEALFLTNEGVSIEGTFQGHHVILLLLHEPPDGNEIASKLTATGAFEFVLPVEPTPPGN